ncbi:MAG TPA: molybdenum cofactor guanylyltransferase [Bacillales bacterium]|nr:molybdenum cofactor guanylyltransferase [Bacillales bacterium]
MKSIGVVLAGGNSRRFGKPKAFAAYKGKPFYERACEVLEPYVDDVVIVGRQEWGSFSSRKILFDVEAFRGKGPLAGIYSVMKKMPAEWYVVLACDMPLMDVSIIERLLCECEQNPETDAIVPYLDDCLQPLAAVYHRTSLHELESVLMEDKLKVKDFLALIRVSYIHGFDSAPFQNVNTKEELHRMDKEASE